MVAGRFTFQQLLRLICLTRRKGLWTKFSPLLKEHLFPGRIGKKREVNPSPPILFQMATNYWLSQAIYVAAKLGIADLLTNGPQSSLALATATGSDAPSLFRLMRALSSVGVFSQVGSDSFALSRLGATLQTNAIGSLRAMVITIGEIHYRACGNLLHSIQTGSPAFNDVFGTSLFQYLQQNDDASSRFNKGMTDVSSILAYAILIAYDFAGLPFIVDVGGGEGTLLRKILELNPEARGTVFDVPAVVATARRQPNAVACGERCSYSEGNFFESVPEGAGAYLLCGVVHDWDDGHAIAILKNCRKAMANDGRVLIVEMIVPEDDSASFSKLLDLNMLVMTGGRERTEREFRSLLDAANYRLRRIIPTLAPQSIIEATPK
jgi:hypothetical protein